MQIIPLPDIDIVQIKGRQIIWESVERERECMEKEKHKETEQEIEN